MQCDDSALSGGYKLIGITVDAANTNTVYATAVSSKDNLQNIQMWLTDDDATVNQGEVAKRAQPTMSISDTSNRQYEMPKKRFVLAICQDANGTE